MMNSKLTPMCPHRAIISITIALSVLLPAARVHGIAGLEGTFEFGLDAPWRIEPNRNADGTLEYGAIPIQITIHDARDAKLDNIIYPAGPQYGGFPLPDNIVSLGKFYSVRVKELSPTETTAIEFPLSALYEVESTTGDWLTTPGEFSLRPSHKICRIWNGEDPEPFRDVTDTGEWHATLWYVPANKTPGTFVALQIEVLLERGSWPPPPLEGTINVVGGPVPVTVPFTVPFTFSPFITLRNYVRVFLAQESLPRFDQRWLYGDFHYHSQGTDNEGEAGYNYRGVIRAMGAMGLDFLFATDHASSSEQIIDADLPSVNKIPDIAHSQGDKLTEDNVRSIGGIVRDMNADRFDFCHDLIYGTNGVNGEASFRASNFRFSQNYKSYGIVPQIFLGGELDAVPELKASTVDANTLNTSDGKVEVSIPYGNGLMFDLGFLCSPEGCDDVRQALLDVADAESNLVRDFQSLESFQFFGREHLVYFPNTSALNVGNETTFIPSRTSRFGGATRRLNGTSPGLTGEPLLPEIERKGVVFVAHHLNGSKGSRGPDSVPWTTDHMLLKAFRSPAVLGLEFWNEDVHHRTSICSHDFCQNAGGFERYERGYERDEKLEVSAVLNFLSLVIFGKEALPEEYHKIALPLEEARRGFVTGDQNGSQFELDPFDVRNGDWQHDSDETERVLHHGAFDWDTMNLRGLDFEKNADLVLPYGWLQPGEPRRMFMAGGSDAHGDLNYRRAGYFLGTEDANDTAIGKPRNLVFVGAPEGPVIYSEGPVAEDPTRPRGASLIKRPSGVALQVIGRPPDVDDPPIIDPIPEPPLDGDPLVIIRPPISDPPILEPPIVDPPPPPPPSPVDPILPPIIDPPVIDPTPSDPPVNPLPDVRPPITNPPVFDPAPPANPVPPLKIPIDDIVGDIGGLKIRAHTQEQIVRALRSGRFCVTDGPAIRIAIDKNGNNQIDDEDVQMGEVHRITEESGAGPGQLGSDAVTLLTEVVSTSEFGPIMEIDIYVGAQPGPQPAGSTEPVEGRLYAPLIHGPQNFRNDAMPSPQISYLSANTTYVRQKDNYWNGEFLGDAITWNHAAGESPGFTHTLITTLHLDKYEVGKGISADRFFVRAFTRTSGDDLQDVPDRYGFSNPIWILRSSSALVPPEDPSSGSQAPGTPTISAILNDRGELVITFTGICTFSPRLGEPFQDLPDAVSPYAVRADKWSGFFRARRP